MQLYGKHIHEGDFSLSSLPTLPSAVKFVSIEGHEDRQLSDLALHRHDLSFVTDCLRELNATSSDFLRSALWQLAVITFIKCFVGSSARIQLDASAIFGKTSGAMEAYRYIKICVTNILFTTKTHIVSAFRPWLSATEQRVTILKRLSPFHPQA